MPFRKGQSGNIKGKPKGASDKRTALRELLTPHAPALVQKAVSLALEGDTSALKLCIDRLMPPIRSKDELVKIPGMKGSPSAQGTKVLQAMATGKLTPGEASEVLSSLAAQARINEADTLVERVAQLEERISGKSQE